MSSLSERLRILLLASIYLALMGVFFSIEGAYDLPWLSLYASLVPALVALGHLLSSGPKGSEQNE
jgi:EamA domain-containing membrane protein RarD